MRGLGGKGVESTGRDVPKTDVYRTDEIETGSNTPDMRHLSLSTELDEL